MRTLPSPSPMTSGGLFPLLLFSGSFHRLRRFPYTRVPFSILWKTLSRALFLFLTANFSSPVLWKWKVKVLVTQSSPTLCDPVDGSSSGSSVHWILQARVLEWVAIPFSRGSPWPRDRTQVSRIAGGFFTIWAPRVLWAPYWPPRTPGSFRLGVGPF